MTEPFKDIVRRRQPNPYGIAPVLIHGVHESSHLATEGTLPDEQMYLVDDYDPGEYPPLLPMTDWIYP